MTSDAELLAQLRAERAARGELAAVLDLHLALIAARGDETAAPPPDVIARGRARLARGEIAFRPADVAFDWPSVRRYARAVCDLAARHQHDLAAAFARVAARLAEVSPEAARRLIAGWLAEPEAEVQDADGAPLTFVLSHALRPTLRAHLAAVLPDLGDEPWPRVHCPVCGGLPDFAALEPDSGQRRLLCARCDAEWWYARVGCPFCGAQGDVGYHMAGEGTYRLYVCGACRRYLKTVDRRETWLRRPLALERILTVGLDIAAAREGYRAAASRAPASNSFTEIPHPPQPGPVYP